MAVMRPVKVTISGFARVMGGESVELHVPHYPFDPSRGHHALAMTHEIFIDAADIRTEATPDFFGFAPGAVVGLKYACK